MKLSCELLFYYCVVINKCLLTSLRCICDTPYTRLVDVINRNIYIKFIYIQTVDFKVHKYCRNARSDFVFCLCIIQFNENGLSHKNFKITHLESIRKHTSVCTIHSIVKLHETVVHYTIHLK